MRLLWLALVAACGAPARPDAPARPPPAAQSVAAPPALAADPHAAVAARGRADAALEQQLPPDYERPFKERPTDRTAIAKLYGEACSFGDKRSCVTQAQLTPLDAKGASYHAVLAHCLAGDPVSCRALPPDEAEPRFPGAPGAVSRRVACQKPTLEADCDLAALHRECSADFPAACAAIAFALPEQPDAEAMLDRTMKLSLTGCRAGIASECKNIPPTQPSDYLEALRRICDLRTAECDRLAFLYKSANDPKRERDTWERACEYGRSPVDCLELAEGYAQGRLEEPVPGRGQELVKWACPRLAASVKTAPYARHPLCATVKP